MNLELFLNLYMLVTAVIGLFMCLYRYVEVPKKVWAFAAFFFLAHYLSDYYWTIYMVVMNTDPNTSAVLAYFGWNLSYVIMLILVFMLSGKEERKFFSIWMLIPVPINIVQFCMYLPYGGLFNNIFQNLICTAVACFSLRGILFWHKNRKEGRKFPWFHFVCLAFIFCEYGMWTSSCFTFENEYLDPYTYFSIASFTLHLFIAPSIMKKIAAEHLPEKEKNRVSNGFQSALQAVVAIIICVGCFGGYFIAKWMRDSFIVSLQGDEESGIYNSIAILLFVVSILVDLIILAFMQGVRSYYKNRQSDLASRQNKGKFNFFFTLITTFVLMAVALFHTSRLLYEKSVTALYSECEDKVSDIATELTNYLDKAQAVLWVTADSTDQMYSRGVGLDMIHDYIVEETRNQSGKLDENFTGLYAYIDGTYLDGLDWEPPKGYDPKKRDWYKLAKEAAQDVILIPPYVDAQTGAVIISISKLLSDNESVVSLDVTLDHLQETVQNLNLYGNGYGMVVDSDGTVIAHHDRSVKGMNCRDIFGTEDFMKAVHETQKGLAVVTIDETEYCIFINDVIDQWYTIVVVNQTELLSDVRAQLIRNICVYVVIFILITFFYFMSYVNEQNANRTMEELEMDKQRREYEAKSLMLEKKAADDANEAKSRFLADMSHEIRTPINAVLGMNEMILRESDDVNIREYAGNIRSSGKALLNLINSILDFSKIEDGKMEIVPVDYRLAGMIHYLQTSIVERASAKGLSLFVEVDHSLPQTLHGDDMRISQVIMNLLTNAVKYTKEGEVRLIFQKAAETETDADIRVIVKDTGIGIRKEDMKKLFESFERLDIEKNRSIEGTGLGMSIVTKLLSMMGSELKVESEYGKGSTFSFVLRQQKAGNERIGDEYERLVEGAGAAPGKDEYRESFRAPDGLVLVVDDTKMNLMVVQKLLKKTCLNIDTAASGKEALVLCAQKKYDVILMDQRMPEMDGSEALSHIRVQQGGMNVDTPVVCLTADALRGAKDKYMAEGFSDYLTKPIDPKDLEDMIRRYLPEDKVKAPSEGSVENDGKPVEKSGLSALSEYGLNIKQALAFCQNDEEILLDVIKEYVTDAPSKLANIKKYYDLKDWKNYTIYVHSLKSTSKMIGAEELSGRAAELEAASKDGDEAIILSGNDSLMKQFKKTAEFIGTTLDIPMDADSDPQDDSDEVIEFSPE